MSKPTPWSVSYDEAHKEEVERLVDKTNTNKSEVGRQLLELTAEVDNLAEYPNGVDDPIKALRHALGEYHADASVNGVEYDPETYDGYLSTDEVRDICAAHKEPEINPDHVNPSKSIPDSIPQKRQLLAAMLRHDYAHVSKPRVTHFVRTFFGSPEHLVENEEIHKQIWEYEFYRMYTVEGENGEAMYATTKQVMHEDDVLGSLNEFRDDLESWHPTMPNKFAPYEIREVKKRFNVLQDRAKDVKDRSDEEYAAKVAEAEQEVQYLKNSYVWKATAVATLKGREDRNGDVLHEPVEWMQSFVEESGRVLGTPDGVAEKAKELTHERVEFLLENRYMTGLDKDALAVFDAFVENEYESPVEAAA
ncbi:hypothetical protein DVK00_02955 [Haloarcula sp. Atlit-47R]|uniref:hypothetical protein n=1 Tax=Haloarcula sp. Atlit-47R TaxID=2282132 RepID=UPI000EF1E334|nr:hypothetical protein [Haloarcula sp. Atlit-47R]RLM47483.1 hypothetical protein DVK00_02955 [Haloarcula sp. Atlit-47R]